MAKFSNGVLLLCWLLISPFPGVAASGASVVSDMELTSALLKSSLVLAALYALSRLALRRQRSLPTTPGRLRVVESIFIERGQRIAILQIDRRELLIACSAAEVRLLTCLSEGNAAGATFESSSGKASKCAPEPQSFSTTTFAEPPHVN